MKNKLNVNLLVPSLKQKYNLFLPINISVSELIFNLNKAINEMTDGEFPISDYLSLANCLTGEILDDNKNLKELSIKNGSLLVII